MPSDRFHHQFQIEVGGSLDAHFGARRQVGAGHPPHRVADLDASAPVGDRLGQRRRAADELVAAPVEQRLVGRIACSCP